MKQLAREDLRPGDIVTLPDGVVAAVQQVIGDDVYVIEWARRFGRGPWIFPAADLVLVRDSTR